MRLLPRTTTAIISTLAGLAACNGSEPDDTFLPDTGTGVEPGTADLQVGEIADMVSEDSGVWAQILNPGTYIVILASSAEEQGTLYGYGEQAKSAARVDPATPRPARPMPSATPAPPLQVGDTREFTVYNGTQMTTIEAEVMQLSDNVVVWVDQTTPNEIGDIDMDTIDGVLTDFESIVIPREERIFGEISDVDDDGRLAVLLSYTVNMYGAQAYVTWCDIGVTDGCWSNNGGEIIYLSIPDPDDSYSSVDAIVETVAHELNHLIYAYHKYVLQGSTSASENVYVTEGWSAMAQDLTGYNNGNQYVWAAAMDMSDFYGSDDYSIQAVSLNDILRGSSYYDYDRDGSLRGAAYLFLRYLFEQAGSMSVEADGTLVDQGGMTWIQDWFDTPEEGVEAVEATTGMDLWEAALDWYTALVVTGRGINDDPVYNYEDRVEDPLTGYEFGIDPYDTIHGWLELTGPKVQLLEEADGEVRAGGVDYLQVTLDEGLFELAVDSGAAPMARLLRIE